MSNTAPSRRSLPNRSCTWKSHQSSSFPRHNPHHPSHKRKGKRPLPPNLRNLRKRRSNHPLLLAAKNFPRLLARVARAFGSLFLLSLRCQHQLFRLTRMRLGIATATRYHLERWVFSLVSRILLRSFLVSVHWFHTSSCPLAVAYMVVPGFVDDSMRQRGL